MKETTIKQRTEQLLEEEVAKVMDKYHKGDLRKKAIKQLRKEEWKASPLNSNLRQMTKLLFPTPFYKYAVIATAILFLIIGAYVLVTFLQNPQKPITSYLTIPLAIGEGYLFIGLCFLTRLEPNPMHEANGNLRKTVHWLYLFAWILMIGGSLMIVDLFTDIPLRSFIFASIAMALWEFIVLIVTVIFIITTND